MQYPAIITKEGAFTLAEFPDCDGCQTFVRKGESIEESASEALEGWIEANLGRDKTPNRPGTVAIPAGAEILQISIPLALEFRLKLRWAREAAGITQAAFGKNLGMTQQQYARLEGAHSNPTLQTIERLSKATGFQLRLTIVDPNSISAIDREAYKGTHSASISKIASAAVGRSVGVEKPKSRVKSSSSALKPASQAAARRK
ncbi:MAG: helix-turn-helix domain-containing protein [Gemmatimonadaceae bacterium]